MSKVAERRITLAPEAIGPADFDAMAAWLETRPRLSQSRLVAEFEVAFAAWLGRRHAILVNSGSSANLIAVAALLESGRLKRGDEVAVPALSWSTDVAPLIQLGLVPVLVDCDQRNLAMEPRGIRSTKAAILVSVLGLVPDMERYDGLILIEDCCEALGSQWHGRKLGVFGELSTFSFFYGHHMTTVEGGMVTTDDDGLAVLLRQLRAHGWDRDTGGTPGEFNFMVPGFNVRATEITAFLGLRQLERLDANIAQRNHLFRLYSRLLGWPLQADGTMVSAMAYPWLSDRREAIQTKLTAMGVESRPLIAGNMGRQPFWIDRYGTAFMDMADEVHEDGFYVPCHQDMTDEDVRRIAEVLK